MRINYISDKRKHMENMEDRAWLHTIYITPTHTHTT